MKYNPLSIDLSKGQIPSAVVTPQAGASGGKLLKSGTYNKNKFGPT